MNNTKQLFIVIEFETVTSYYALQDKWELERVWINVTISVDKSHILLKKGQILDIQLPMVT